VCLGRNGPLAGEKHWRRSWRRRESRTLIVFWVWINNTPWSVCFLQTRLNDPLKPYHSAISLRDFVPSPALIRNTNRQRVSSLHFQPPLDHSTASSSIFLRPASCTRSGGVSIRKPFSPTSLETEEALDELPRCSRRAVANTGSVETAIPRNEPGRDDGGEDDSLGTVGVNARNPLRGARWTGGEDIVLVLS